MGINSQVGGRREFSQAVFCRGTRDGNRMACRWRPWTGLSEEDPERKPLFVELDTLLKAVQTPSHKGSWLTHLFLLPKGPSFCLSKWVHLNHAHCAEIRLRQLLVGCLG